MIKYMKNAIFLILFFSCSVYKFSTRDFQNSYSKDDDKNIKLIFKNNSFVYTDEGYHSFTNPYKCCDTITYGNWILDNKHGIMELTSPDILNLSIVNLNVKESSINSDTTIFKIVSPIENHYLHYNETYRDIYYKISLNTDNATFNEKTLTKIYNNNPIKIYNPNHVQIRSFYILIYPKDDIKLRNIGTREVTTLEYKVQNPNSNEFTINIPQLNYGYFAYVRLNKDYIKIMNTNKIEWDGHVFSK